ncbi:hypothetical protein [Weissella bombi]|uniref:Uncharacterized protein n=1 Tax=Weissella bombi TaxID=1505725 RepID=A0A1C4A8X1_9LACO|nr:hypothetical protein [Weissella bombi]SCB90900.1 hypothetical protein GA0061074_10474 [Weissella bombi]
MHKGIWVGIVSVLAVIAGTGGALYANQQSEHRDELKTKQAKNSSMSKKIDKANSKSSKTDKETSSSKQQEETSVSSSSSSSSSSSEDTSNTQAPVHLTDEQKQSINASFLDWASQRAEIGNMAVNDEYFNHGAAGRGDWYANTPDGEIQVQDLNNPGQQAFPIHAIGGCVFLIMKNGTTGKQEDVVQSTANGYSDSGDMSKPVTKYVLGDNGKVYELQAMGYEMSVTSGFGEYQDDGTRGTFKPDSDFIVSKDQAAQDELQKLINAYR